MAPATLLERLPLQRVTSAAAVAMALLLTLFQYVLTPGRAAPFFLFAIFVAVWLFGAVMLLVAPRFGAAGTAAYGFISAAGVVRMHLTDWGDYLTLAGSLITAALAVAFMVQMLRAGGEPAG